MFSKRLIKLSILLSMLLPFVIQAQSKLDLKISLEAKREKIVSALNEISRKTGIVFSYNSSLFPGDSLVQLSDKPMPVKMILLKLLGPDYEFPISGKYVIIRKKESTTFSGVYYISGYVYDKGTNAGISNASVYNREQLTSTLTNSDGSFHLKLKENVSFLSVFVSKDLYIDTFLTVRPESGKELRFYLSPQKIGELPTLEIRSKIEQTWLSKMMLSSSQVVQSLNIKRFFENKPVQISFMPRISSHGRMSSQVVNKISLNIIGGYTAGTRGIEFGGLFNINKKDATGLQVAGLFNNVGGEIKGVQIGGLQNYGLAGSSGVQVAGIVNKINDNVKGIQLSGIYNKTGKSLNGIQASGIGNIAKDSMKGLQFSGINNKVYGHASGAMICAGLNTAKRDLNGFQFGVINYARILNGAQIGLVNIADSSSGISLGLINIVRHGYHRINLSTSDILQINATYKSGNQKLYSLVNIGANIFNNKKAYALGIGLGRQWTLSRQFYISTDATASNLCVGSWKKSVGLYRIEPSFNWVVAKNISLYSGPALSFLSRSLSLDEEYKSGIKSNKKIFAGWQIGVGL